jgi:hypothetical protein
MTSIVWSKTPSSTKVVTAVLGTVPLRHLVTAISLLTWTSVSSYRQSASVSYQQRSQQSRSTSLSYRSLSPQQLPLSELALEPLSLKVARLDARVVVQVYHSARKCIGHCTGRVRKTNSFAGTVLMSGTVSNSMFEQ